AAAWSSARQSSPLACVARPIDAEAMLTVHGRSDGPSKAGLESRLAPLDCDGAGVSDAAGAAARAGESTASEAIASIDAGERVIRVPPAHPESPANERGADF